MIKMINKIVLLCFLLVWMQCSKDNHLKVKLLNEFVLSDTLLFNGFKVGGISDITFVNDTLFMAIDDAQNPRILKATLAFTNQQLTNLKLVGQTHIQNDSLLLNQPYFDVEAIFVTKNNQLFLASEGNITQQKQPLVFSLHPNGKLKSSIKLPNYLAKVNNHYHNKSFEAMCLSFDKKGFWLATEAPLQIDGEPASFEVKNYPIRISYYDFKQQKFTKQFVYLLDNIKNNQHSKININGLTSIIEIADNEFITVERLYQSDLGSYGNQVRLYYVKIDDKTTNSIAISSLKNETYKAVKKELLFDFNTIKSQLTDGIIDNIEGITFGPKLKNGNRTLLLASDDNFQVYGKQLNQFILLELLQPSK